jgi:hypothetical protein
VDDGYHAPISLLVPTRWRKNQLLGMWDSAQATATHPELLHLVTYIDADDPLAVDAIGIPGTTIVGPRILLSTTWERCYEAASSRWSGGIYWHGNDDVLFRSDRWDMEVREAFRAIPDRIGCVHGRDGIHDGGMATLGFYSQEWVDALGYFMPPYFSSDYNDTWQSTIAD